MPGPYSPTDLRNYVGVGLEVTKGTPVAPTLWGAYVDPVDLSHNIQTNKLKEAGVNGEVTFLEKISQMPSGAFSILARPQSVARLIAYALGKDTIGAAVSGVTPHTEIPDYTATDYVSIEQNLADAAIERFLDAAITEVTLTCNRDNPTLRARFGWMGGAPTAGGAATAESYETEIPWVLAEAAFTVNGSAVTNVIGFELVIRMLASQERTTNVVPRDVMKYGGEVDLTLESIMDDWTTEYRDLVYGSPSGTAAPANAKTGAFIVDFTRGAAGTARELKATVANLTWENPTYTPLDPNGSEEVKLTRTASATNVSGGNLISVLAKTTDASAYVS